MARAGNGRRPEASGPGVLARVISAVLNTSPAVAVGRGLGLRSYQMAGASNAWANWTTVNRDPNAVLRDGLRVMQARSRDLARNEDYARGFLKRVRAGVLGRAGIRTRFVGLDDQVLAVLAAEFAAWSKRGLAGGGVTLDGLLSWRGLQRAIVVGLVRDGEFLARKVFGREAGPWGFAVQPIDPVLLDAEYTRRLEDGNRVIMGVEIDGRSRPVAYYLLVAHPDAPVAPASVRRRVRVPASGIVHIFDQEEPGQVRGVPWFNPTGKRLRQFGEYEQAELVAARTAASKMGFFTGGVPEEWGGEEADLEGEGGPAAGARNRDGDLVFSVQPGEFGILPDGAQFTPFDPQHPTSQYPAFTKTMLRGAAAGLGVSYAEFAGDLEGVNYSSIRQGVLGDRDQWADFQALVIEGLDDLVGAWLEAASLAGRLPLKTADLARVSRVFMPRGWAWVDPLKEIAAKEKEIELGLTSRQRVAEERGADFAEIAAELAEEEGGPRRYQPASVDLVAVAAATEEDKGQ